MNSTIDKRTQLSIDDAKQREIRLKLIAQSNLEQRAIYNAKQALLFPNTVLVQPAQTLNEIISSELKGSGDEFLQYQSALAKVSRIASNDNSQYIIDRLEPDEIAYLNLHFDKIFKDITDGGYKNIDKDLFISIVKDNTEDNNKKNSTRPIILNSSGNAISLSDKLSARGEQRQLEQEEIKNNL